VSPRGRSPAARSFYWRVDHWMFFALHTPPPPPPQFFSARNPKPLAQSWGRGPVKMLHRSFSFFSLVARPGLLSLSCLCQASFAAVSPTEGIVAQPDTRTGFSPRKKSFLDEALCALPVYLFRMFTPASKPPVKGPPVRRRGLFQSKGGLFFGGQSRSCPSEM